MINSYPFRSETTTSAYNSRCVCAHGKAGRRCRKGATVARLVSVVLVLVAALLPQLGWAQTLARTICDGESLNIMATVTTPGTPNYTYDWSATPNTEGYNPGLPSTTTFSRSETSDTISITPRVKSDATYTDYTYVCDITDGNGCRIQTNMLVVRVNALPTVAITALDGAVCPNVESVDLTGTVTSTTPADYTYTWGGDLTVTSTHSETTPSFTNTATLTIPTTPCNKDYTVSLSVTDGNNCTSATAEVTVQVQDNTPPAIGTIDDDDIVDAIANGSECKYKIPDLQSLTVDAASDGCGGGITWVGQSVAANTLYAQTGSEQLIDVTVKVRDGCGNQASKPVRVRIPANSFAVKTIDSTFVCGGGSAGRSITLTTNTTGGTGDISYSWTPATGLSAPLYHSPSTTTSITTTTRYVLTATDGNGCTAKDSVKITVEPPIVPNISVSPNPVCVGNSVSLSSSPTGGTGTYSSYAWTTTIGTSTIEDASLASTTGTPSTTGTVSYKIVVTDDLGCNNAAVENITVNPLPTFFDAVQQHVSCNGGHDGIINVSPSSAGTYDISINNGATWPYTGITIGVSEIYQITGLAAGTYHVRIRDGNECISADNTVIISEPTAISEVSNATTQPHCHGGSDGRITVTVTGGTVGSTTPYYNTVTLDGVSPTSSSVSGGNYTFVFEGIGAGSHTFYVKDSKDCEFTSTIDLGEPSAVVAPAITVSSAAVCLGSTVSLSANTASGGTPGYTYAWTSTDVALTPATPTSPAVTAATHTPSSAGTVTYTLTVTDANSCTGTSSVNVTVNPLPTVAVTPTSATICNGSSTTLTASGASTYTWAPSTGLSATTGAEVTANPTATTTYTVTGTDANNCVNTATVTVTVNPLPTITVTPSAATQCPNGQTVTVSGSMTTAGTPNYNYTWNIGPLTLADGSATTISNTSSTTPSVDVIVPTGNCNTNYDITLSVTDANGCTATSGPVTAITVLDNTVPELAAGESWPADITDVDSCFSENLTNRLITTAAAAALYTDNCGSVTVTVTNTTYDKTDNCDWKITRTYTVSDDCGNSFDKTQSVSGGDHIQPVIGDITLPAIVSAGSCQYSIPDLQDATIDASTDNCSATVTWVGQTASTAPDDGDKYNQTDVDRTVTVTVTVRDDCGNEASKEVTYTIPKNDLSVTASDDTTICYGGTAHLAATATGGSTPLGYSWTPAAGMDGASTENATITLSEAGDHTYRVTVTDNNGCSQYEETTVYVRPKMTLAIDAGSHDAYCKDEAAVDNLTVTPTGDSGRYTYTWTMDDGSTTTTVGNSATITPGTATVGTFTYTVEVVDNAGCGDSTREVRTITVNPLPELTVSPTDQSICPGGTITAVDITATNATTTIDNVTLTHEGTTTASSLATLGLSASPDPNPTTVSGVVAAASGDTIRFTVTATNGNGCGTLTQDVRITIGDTNIVTYTVDTCDHYHWVHDGGIDYTPADNGTHRFGVFNDASGCDSVTYLHLTLHADPTPTVDDQTVCLGSTATLTVNEVYGGYTWSNGATTQSIDTVPKTAGTHTVGVTVTEIHSATAQCQGSTTATITVQDTVTLSVTNAEQTVCLGDAIAPIEITSGNATINDLSSVSGIGLTLTGDASSATISGSPTPASGSAYTYTVTATSVYTAPACAPKEATISITVNDTVAPEFSAGDEVCTSSSLANDSIEISVQALDGYSYAWDIDGGTLAASSPHDTNSIVVRWAGAGDKTVSVTVTNNATGCSGSKTKTIHVYETPAVEIATVATEVCPHSGTYNPITATVTTATTADYTYNWGGGITLAPATTTTDATNNAVTATIPTTSCDTVYKIGVNVVDAHGCKANADTVSLTVKDTEAPTFTRPADIVLYKSATCTYDISESETGEPTSLNDNCTAESSLTVGHNDVDVTPADSCMGLTIIERSWYVVDQCGNRSTGADSVQTIRIRDNTAPVIVGTLAAIDIEGCGEGQVPAATETLDYLRANGLTISDNCSDDAHLTVSSTTPALSGACDKTTTRTYRITDDCGNYSEVEQTITITYPAMAVPADGASEVSCADDAVEPSHPDIVICETSYPAADDSDFAEQPVVSITNGAGTVTYNYIYTDCYGTAHKWSYVYTVTPGAFTPVASTDTTVHCVSDVLAENEVVKPSITVCNATVEVVFDSATSTITAGCGDSVYHYHYVVNGETYNWSRTFQVSPEDFAVPADSVKSVGCPSEVRQPDTVAGMMPVVTSACGNVLTPALESADMVPACQDSVIYTYKYSDCAGHEHQWRFRYAIERSGAPEVATGYDNASTVECLAAATQPAAADVPHATSSCGEDIEGVLLGSDTVWNAGSENCEGTVSYTYKYIDCAGDSSAWTYTYTIERQGAVTVNTAGVADRDTVECAGMAMATFTVPVGTSSCDEDVIGVLTDSTYTDDAGSCNATKTYTYTYTDCSGGNSATWTFTYRIELPEEIAEVPADGTGFASCAVDATRPGAATIQDACGRDIVPVYLDSTAAMNPDGTGTVTHRYTYSDCAGHDSVWSYVYTVTPDVFTPLVNDTAQVHCVSDIVEPTIGGTPAIPVVTVCGSEYHPTLSGTTNTVGEGGCGDSVFTYSYTVNDVEYHWSYVYQVSPEPFSLPDDEGTTVERIADVNTPTAPVVTNSCPVTVNSTLDHIDTVWTGAECEGTIAFVYRYEDCIGHEDFWTYTYTIRRSTRPSEQEPAVATTATVACIEEAVLPAVMPVITDVAGTVLTPSDTLVTEENNNCGGTRSYRFTYTDCAGLDTSWTFTYTVLDTIKPEIGAISLQSAIAAGGCQFRIPDLSQVTLNASSDNCGHAVSFVSQAPAAGELFDQYHHQGRVITVRVTVADECGNENYRDVNVYIPASEVHVEASSDVSVCRGESVALSATGGSNNLGGTVEYSWSPAASLEPSTGTPVTATPDDTTTYTVVATDENGCRDTDNVTVTVFPLVELTATGLEQTVCAGGNITPIAIHYVNANVGVSGLPDDLQFSQTTPGNAEISGHPNHSGSFTITAVSLYGCPTQELTGSIVVADTLITNLSETACDSYVWPTDGGNYAQSGRYRWSTVNADGCDSVVYLNLTINHQSFGIDDVTACDSYTWTRGNGQTYTASTQEPTHLLPNGNAVGCDSTVTLHLTVHYSTSSEENINACDSYTWNGTTYTEDTETSVTLRNQWDCDSIATLHLLIHPSYHFLEYDSLCAGDTYTYHGDAFTAGGVYDHIYRSTHGCDSVYTMTLTELPTLTVSVEKEVDCISGWYDLTAVALPQTDVFSYRWGSRTRFGSNSNEGSDSTIHVSPRELTTYYVTVGYGNNMLCPQRGEITVDRFVKPQATITVNPASVTPDNLRWYANYEVYGDRAYTVREWYIDGQYYNQQNEHIYGDYDMNSGNDSVIIELIARSEQCADTAHMAIPYYFETLYVPNVFTPKIDINNLFGAEGVGITEFEMWVYNRDGLLVFHSTTLEEKWDGTHNGTDCPMASYVYRINYKVKSIPEGYQTKVGSVMLLK